MSARWLAALAGRHRGWLTIALVVLFVPSIAGLQARANYAEVSYAGGAMGGDTPLLLGFGSTNQPHPVVFYAYRPNGEVRIQVGVANDGDLPVFVTGIAADQEWSNLFSSTEIRLPPQPTMKLLPLYAPTDGGPWYSVPARQFEVAPHTGTTFALVLRIRDNGDTGEVPTRAPSAAPTGEYSGGGVSIDTMPLSLSVDGVSRTIPIRLPMTIVVVQGDGTGAPSGVPDR